jgi:hypothetical protein
MTTIGIIGSGEVGSLYGLRFWVRMGQRAASPTKMGRSRGDVVSSKPAISKFI